ncbi:nucleoside hydrolase [Flammeovirgaceae bacterium SG7u.111]|nr:nucleoside hydrolase [Flammeovirgaceae bacterium SG7u.132]WPO37530.1 nucleoside hydrolase [Flammeovirgaceae bacterium SG7u.111]
MKRSTFTSLFLSLFLSLIFIGCSKNEQKKEEQAPPTLDQRAKSTKIPILIDTDANNELDDQHALAYAFFNGDVFDVVGVTVNVTNNGGGIEEQFEEAERVMQLCGVEGKIPLYSGASASFEEIRSSINDANYDGSDAVEFIIAEARKLRKQKLVLLPVGKLTNIALALIKAPDIKDKVRIVWLGSNYPEPGEYNLENDIPSMNYILDQDVPFEMVMVRYGKSSGSDAVRATPAEIADKMPGAGPTSEPIEGRHGGAFTNFGDYAVDLFEHIDLHGNPPSRALFDMVAVAIVKNPSWGEANEIPAPIMVEKKWEERPENERSIIIWENFDSPAITEDFYETMAEPVIAE